MTRPFLRNVFPHPAHPRPDWFSLEELAAWDVELLVWGVRRGYWSAEAFVLTPVGATLLDRLLNYYGSAEPDRSFVDQAEAALVLYMNQIEWTAPGESTAETELRLAFMHHKFETKVKEPADSGDFQPNRHLTECRGPDPHADLLDGTLRGEHV